MHWISLVFIVIVADGLQHKATEIDGKNGTTEVSSQLIHTECENDDRIQADGCRNGHNIMMNVTWVEFLGTKLLITDIKSPEEECATFTMDNGSFTANLTHENSNCTYNFYSSVQKTSYYVKELQQIKSECPSSDKVCVKTESCPLTNLTVYANPESRKLNITWNTTTNRDDNFIKFNIITNSNYKNEVECIVAKRGNQSERNFFNPVLTVDPGCVYNVEITPINQNEQFYCTYIYTVPDCIGESCDCDKFRPRPKILDVKKTDEGKFLVEWDPGQTTAETDIPYTIERVEFDYNSSEVPEQNVEQNISGHFSTVQMSLVEGEMYNIKGIFKNNFSCTQHVIFNYTVPECPTFSRRPQITEVTKISADEFRIKWDPGQTAVNMSYVIQEVKFSYKNSKEDVERAPEYIEQNLTDHESNVTMKFLQGETYTIKGVFTNNFRCTVEVIYNYAESSTSTANSVPVAIILLGTCVGVMIILVIWQYSNLKNYFIKMRRYGLVSQSNTQNFDPTAIPLQSPRTFRMVPNFQYIPAENFHVRTFDEFEFPREQIKLKEIIGSGAFGQVYSAKANGIGGIEGDTMVAVKTLGESTHVTADQLNDFISEIAIFKKIGRHPNIVSLLGCCTSEAPYMMIMELVPCGDLQKYLVDLRVAWRAIKQKNDQRFFSNSDEEIFTPPLTPTSPTFGDYITFPSTSEAPTTPLKTPRLADYADSMEKVLDPTELQNFACQIAKGMAHLEKRQITHRDLAARNILINQHKVLKISDFGLSRLGPYINQKNKKIPLRWMAIESILSQKYDNKSDVWSFGVVLWEIGTLGAFPYGLSVPDTFILQFLQMGRRLERPIICTDQLSALMERCWAADPNDRPTFKELVEELDVRKNRIYVDFNHVNPMYIFPPATER